MARDNEMNRFLHIASLVLLIIVLVFVVMNRSDLQFLADRGYARSATIVQNQARLDTIQRNIDTLKIESDLRTRQIDTMKTWIKQMFWQAKQLKERIKKK